MHKSCWPNRAGPNTARLNRAVQNLHRGTDHVTAYGTRKRARKSKILFETHFRAIVRTSTVFHVNCDTVGVWAFGARKTSLEAK